MKQLSIQILSVPHREKLIAEIQYNHYAIAEINYDYGYFQVEVFSYDNVQLMYSLDEFIDTLKKAKLELLEINNCDLN